MLENEDRELGFGDFDEDDFDDFEYDGDETVNDDNNEAVQADEKESVRGEEEEQSAKEDADARAETDREAEKAKEKAGHERQREVRRRWSKIKKPLILACCVIVFAMLGFFGYALTTVREDKVMHNVYIEGMNVGGLTYDETLASINASYLFENSELTLTDGKTVFTVNGADIGLSALPEQTAQKAMDYCKGDNIFVKAFNAGMLIFKPHVIIPAPQVDDGMLTEKLNECGVAMNGERKEHYYELTKDLTATFYSGQTGYDGDCTKAKEQVMEALNNEKLKNIHVDFNSAPPQDMTLEQLDAMVYADPVNAYYEYNGNEVSIVPDINGRYIDKDAVAPLVADIYEGCEPVDVPYIASYADVTAAALNDKLFANTLSSYVTSYGGSTENRKANVARAASLISGTVVPPGEVFSFNDTVGHRTRENGFYTAKEYINGESVDGIGGGTCQVSSTLYSAVLYADMNIVERLNHMMSVGYIPLGQDATVADGGVDFKFKNSSDYPVKIVANTNGSSITVTILGTDWDPPRKIEIANTSTSVGENTVVYSKRYVYSNGELISTDTLNSSTYMPHKVAAAVVQPSDDDDDDDE